MKALVLSLFLASLFLFPSSYAHTMTSLEAETPISLGEVIRLSAEFENSGPATFAMLVADVYRGSEKVTVINSDEMSVPEKGTRELVAYYIPQESGTYTIRARVSYGEGTTPARTAGVVVEKESTATGWANNEPIPLGLGMMVIVMVFVSMFIMYVAKSGNIIRRRGLQDKRK